MFLLKVNKMDKQVLYYVLKYEDKYYTPYMSMAAFDSDDGGDVDQILSPNRRLAVRFGTKEVAQTIRKMEIGIRGTYNKKFKPSKCRIFAVVRKERVLN